MSWIKRNLYFLIGAVVAVALLGLAGWYCFSKWQLNNQNFEELTKNFNDWRRIIILPNSPGNEQVNNIENARVEEKRVREKIRDIYRFFTPIPPIPNPPNNEAVTKQEFFDALRTTILQLQRAAANNSVSLPQADYGFSFKAQQPLFNFAPGSLGPLSVQLGEVKSICDVLFRARINSLDSLQRERVSNDDLKGPLTDYLDAPLMSVTNDLAIMTPYVIKFHSFSTELAGVLAGFGNDPHGFIVKGVNVEPASAAGAGGADAGWPSGMMAVPGGAPIPGEMNRFGGMPAAPAAAPAGKAGLQVILDEKPLQVTLVVQVVKLLPKK